MPNTKKGSDRRSLPFLISGGARLMLAAAAVFTIVAASSCGAEGQYTAVTVVVEDTATAIAVPTETASVAPVTATARATPTAEPGIVMLTAVGDVMMARSIGRAVLSDGPGVVFAGVREVLAEADIAFANVESAISELGSPANKGYTFNAPPETIRALADAGIDVVALANNHALDYGEEALLDTRARLVGAGIGAVGAGADVQEAQAPALLERNGTTFAFLAYVDTPAEGSYNETNWGATAESPGVAWASVEAIEAGVTAATAIADVVVVSLHVGIEYSTTPSDLQRTYAQAAIDAGAALVLGSHAHVLQPVEEHGDGLIAYSLGNFVFDGFEGEANRTGILLVTFNGRAIQGWEMLPASVVSGFPVLD